MKATSLPQHIFILCSAVAVAMFLLHIIFKFDLLFGNSLEHYLIGVKLTDLTAQYTALSLTIGVAGSTLCDLYRQRYVK